MFHYNKKVMFFCFSSRVQNLLVFSIPPNVQKCDPRSFFLFSWGGGMQLRNVLWSRELGWLMEGHWVGGDTHIWQLKSFAQCSLLTTQNLQLRKWDLVKIGGTWWNLAQPGGTWWNLAELGRTWQNIAEHGKTVCDKYLYSY